MSSGHFEKCTNCGAAHESKWNIYAKCERCRGIRTKEELSKLSTEEQIQLRWKLRRKSETSQEELYNLIGQCKHPELTKKHLHYDRWLDEVVDDNIHSNQEDSFVWCVVCGQSFGWGCPKSPKGYCEFPSNLKEEEIHRCTLLYCVHCKKPKDRWRNPEDIKDKVTYEPTKEEIDAYMEKMKSSMKKVPYVNFDAGIPEVSLTVSDEPIVGRMRYLIGNFRIDRDEYWFLTDAERQALHDTHNPGSKAIQFDPRFAEKYGKNPKGPF